MLTVIIPTNGITDILKKVLFLLNFQTFKDFEVFVVDTSNQNITNQTIDIDLSYGLKIISCQYSTKSHARNLGLRISKSEYVLFLDADMLPHRDLIYHHLSILNKSKAACVGLELRTKTTQEYEKVLQILQKVQQTKHENQQISYINQMFKQRFSNKSRKNLLSRKIEWYKFLTGNLSCKRETFIKAGMFDANFVSYGYEDLELGYRFNKLGIPIIFNPRAITIHLHPLPTDKRIQNKIESVQNLKKFYYKYLNQEILQKLGINFYSRIVYEMLPNKIKQFLMEYSEDYKVNYVFWKSFVNEISKNN